MYALIERLQERITFSSLVPQRKDDAFDLGLEESTQARNAMGWENNVVAVSLMASTGQIKEKQSFIEPCLNKLPLKETNSQQG